MFKMREVYLRFARPPVYNIPLIKQIHDIHTLHSSSVQVTTSLRLAAAPPYQPFWQKLVSSRSR
jgi:hypothetical protein